MLLLLLLLLLLHGIAVDLITQGHPDQRGVSGSVSHGVGGGASRHICHTL